MPIVQARRARRIALIFLLIISSMILPGPSGQAAAPAPQRADGLDRPLLAANNCGGGEPGETQFSFAATGDTFPHETIQAVAEAQGYDYLFDRVRPFLKAADIAYTNFDGAMLEGSPYTGYPAFNYNPALATALKNAGIGVVSTANNHILDRGPEGLDATLEVLRRAGIAQHGALPTSAARNSRPAYLPIRLTRDGVGIDVAFLSVSWGTNGIPDPYGQVNLLWESDDYGQQGGLRQSVLDAIAQARRDRDVVIVAAHWGYEYEFYPSSNQIDAAARMAAAGADVILGAQPHTLQPVDIIDTNGRKTLVIYSLANFIAAQGAFQPTSFSDTSVILYVGLTRHADGKVSVSGYRYLPTMMTDGDTRPAPIPAEGYDSLIDHVRLEMRDFQGALQVAPDPAALGAHVDVCPGYSFPGAPGPPIDGDFAQYVATLGSGTTPHPQPEALAVFGSPLGRAVRELAGDCRNTTSVLYTERQRLEWHPAEQWPFRVIGTQIGAEVYRRKYQVREPQRRRDLDGDAIADERFKAFYQRYGGLAVFGYPISGLLLETDAQTGERKMVQYFERARFELVPGAPQTAALLDQVRLGLLGREYPGIAVQCGLHQAAASAGANRALVAPAPVLATPPAAADDQAIWLLAGLGSLILLGISIWGFTSSWRSIGRTRRRRRYAPGEARRRVRERRAREEARTARGE